MIDKQSVLRKIIDTGVVAVIRADSPEQAFSIIDAVKAGGIKAIEVTMTVPGAVEVIKELSAKYKDDVIIGAGSVLDSETARSCILAGAEYIVGPSFDLETVKLCNRYQKPIMPGAMTVTEVKRAMDAGADIVKIFPATLFGPKIIKAIKGPIPQAPLMPTGGVNLDNVADWIKAGSTAVGVGSSLTAAAKDGDFAKITTDAAELIKRIKAARAEL